MKHFLLIDAYSNDCKEKTDLQGLIDTLYSELEEDAVNNWEKDIVESNFKTLKKIIDLQSGVNNYDNLVNYVIEELKGYGWIIKDLYKIREDLNDFMDAKNYNKDSQESIYLNETLKLVEKELR